ncbi:MAG: zinc ribbon domain-containing protein [Dehalococcoidia bacterium]|nr:zinc ribbon domain-containing protein [Dehalococcoidia bacterium]
MSRLLRLAALAAMALAVLPVSQRAPAALAEGDEVACSAPPAFAALGTPGSAGGACDDSGDILAQQAPQEEERDQGAFLYCQCQCAGREAGWACGIMDGPRCYYEGGICRFSGWGEGSAPLPAAGSACYKDCFEKVKLRRLCEEAFSSFDIAKADQAKASNLHLNRDDIIKDWDGALKAYDEWAKANGKTAAHVSSHLGGTLPALSWLFSYGGMVDAVSDRFVFLKQASAADQEKARKNPSQAPRGSEPALLWAMQQRFAEKGRKLTPKDVMELALQQRDGDVREATLLAHNTLRSMGRAGDQEIVGVTFQPESFTNMLETIREGDNAGPWYHTFGTAYFELQARGDLGPTAVAAILSIASAGKTAAIARLITILELKGYAKSPTERAAYASQLANYLEQLYREYRTGEQPDPEKYCVNVWGAQAGAWLFGGRVPMSGPDLTGTAKDVLKTTRDLGLTVIRGIDEGLNATWNWITKPRTSSHFGGGSAVSGVSGFGRNRTGILMSPANILWEGDGQKMLLDQSTEGLYGFYPVPLLPFYESESQTWGTAWTYPAERDHRVTLTAVADSTVHLVIYDNETGMAAEYAPEMKKGEEVTVSLTAQRLGPAMLHSNGTLIEPKILEYGKKGSTAGDGNGRDTTLLIIVLAAGLAGLAALGFGGRAMLKGRTVATAGQRCPRCGAGSAAGTRFCRNCGQRVA